MRKKLQSFKAMFLLLMVLLFTGQTWATEATYSFTPDQTTTGSTSTSYVTTAFDFTYEGIGWSMNQWNPNTLQVKTNQSTAANEFNFHNTTAFSGKITKVVITFSALTLKSSDYTYTGMLFKGGTAEVTELTTSGATNGVWDPDTKTLTWTPSEDDSSTYFAFFQNGKVASGSNFLAEADAIVVTYEEGAAPAVATPAFSVASGTYYEAQSVEITDETEGATIKYSTDGENYNDYTEAINVAETTTLYAKAVKGEDESGVARATYTIAKTYASLSELIQETAEKQPVVVTLNNEVIDSLYISGSYRNGVYVTVDGQAFEIYCRNVPEEWGVGGKLSGTVKGTYQEYKNLKEICPSSWDGITCVMPQFANDFEDGTLGDWTATVPESPYKGGFAVADYTDTKTYPALKEENIGTNDLGSTYCLQSTTGSTNGVKGNSDNWLTSPAVTVKEDAPIFSFRLAANCSYSPTKDEAEKMKMDVVVIDGADSTVIATVAPENYFTWKQYAFDLTSYVGKSIQVAFHDYGTAGSGSIKDLKYIDNIKMGNEAYSDYAIEEVTPIHGQAEYSAPTYTVRVTNYGISKASCTVSYLIGDAVNDETIESDIAGGKSVEYTFQEYPQFTPGETANFRAFVTAEDDAMSANDSTAVQSVAACAIAELPYAVCNAMDEEGNTEDAVETEFAAATSSSKAKWAYDEVKYNAWIYSLTSASKQGEGYLYTTKAFTLPAGKYTLNTIGTATLTDNYYEVYVAKYGAEGMADYATKVGQSDTLRDVTTTETIDTTTVVLDIPEDGTYVLGIRPMTATKNAQMTIIGYSLENYVEPLTATFDPADGAELASFEKGDLITMTLSDPTQVGYVYWSLKDNNAEDESNAVLRTGMMKKNDDGSWYAKFYSQQKLLAGHTYTVTAYCYATEADSQGDTSYANTIAQLTATYTGTTATFEYSPVTLVSVSPVEGTILKTVNDNVITAVFSDVVTLTANKNGGMGGENTAMECASEDGITWTITIPESVMTSTSGSLNLNVYVKDADGKVVKGDAGEDETSYFTWSYVTYIGSPEFTVTPGSGEVEQIDNIRVSYSGGINNSWQAADKIKIYNEADEVVYTVADEDFVYDEEDYTFIDIKLSTPITEPGTYKVVFPTIYFALGEEFDGYMSKEQTVTYTITGVADGINNINATDSTPAYNIAGQRVNNATKGIIIKNGKKYLNK